MNDEDIQQFMNAFEDFMKHADMEMTKWVYESPDGGKTVYRRKRGTNETELVGSLKEKRSFYDKQRKDYSCRDAD
jgi:hypothetical protein